MIPILKQKRLGTVLNFVRDGDLLTVDVSVAVDMAVFEREAAIALANREPAVARSALARVLGPVLPDDVYSEWAVIARERVVRLQVRLLSMLAEMAREEGNVDAALWAYDELIALERDDEEHYVDPAELLLRNGRPDRALHYLRRADSAMAELGLDVTARARALRDEAVWGHS